MKIQIAGLDPSFRNWGIALATLDLETGELDDLVLHLVQTGDAPKNKQVRQNSIDLIAAEELAKGYLSLVQGVTVVFAEVPHGSQSAAAMKGYGVCIGLLGFMRAMGTTIIEVNESESKKLMAGIRTATKQQMIDAAFTIYPNANWPMRGGKVVAGKAEHMADAIAAIHAGCQTQEFKALLTLLRKHTQ
jgi:hypothetical protein